MLRKVFKTGNSIVVSLPKDSPAFLGRAEGSEVSVELDRERRQVIIAPVDTSLPGCRTALVMPIYNEDPAGTTAALRAMAESLAQADAAQHFEIVILSHSTRSMPGSANRWRTISCGATCARS